MSANWIRRIATLGSLGILLLLCTSCLGPGHATGRLYNFNRDFESKWAQEGMFIVLLPGYVVFSLGDHLVFNSVQWWTGENPIDPPDERSPSDFGL
jgi:hypothetical protein